MRSLIARLPRLFLLPALVAIVAPKYSAAQTGLASLAPGTHVRVTATPLGPAARPARVVTASADTLVVRPDDASGFDVTVPRTEITQLDVSAGRTTRKKRLALLGAGAGALVGLVAGAASYTDPCVENPAICAGWFYETRQTAAAGGFVSGAVLGAIGGAIAGQIWKTDRWVPHPLRRQSAALRIVPTPSQRRSVALVLTMAAP